MKLSARIKYIGQSIKDFYEDLISPVWRARIRSSLITFISSFLAMLTPVLIIDVSTEVLDISAYWKAIIAAAPAALTVAYRLTFKDLLKDFAKPEEQAAWQESKK